MLHHWRSVRSLGYRSRAMVFMPKSVTLTTAQAEVHFIDGPLGCRVVGRRGIGLPSELCGTSNATLTCVRPLTPLIPFTILTIAIWYSTSEPNGDLAFTVFSSTDATLPTTTASALATRSAIDSNR